MANPLVSVIIPAYNCGRFIGEALDSVLIQDYGPMEVVVVDDGSSDDTLQVLARYGNRVRVLTQPNAGPAAARNHAIRQARGEYLAFLDGDDVWLPGQPRILMEYVLSHPATRVVYGEWGVWYPLADGSYPPLRMAAAVKPVEIDAAQSGWVYPQLLLDSIICIISTVIHRSVYDAVGGFDETLRTGSDYDFWLKVGRRFEVVKLKVALAMYRQNQSSVTHTVRRENNGYRLLQRALQRYGRRDETGHEASQVDVQARLAELAFAHGYQHYWRGEGAIALHSFMDSLSHRPLQPRAAAYVLASLAKRLKLYDPAG